MEREGLEPESRHPALSQRGLSGWWHDRASPSHLPPVMGRLVPHASLASPPAPQNHSRRTQTNDLTNAQLTAQKQSPYPIAEERQMRPKLKEGEKKALYTFLLLLVKEVWIIKKFSV